MIEVAAWNLLFAHQIIAERWKFNKNILLVFKFVVENNFKQPVDLFLLSVMEFPFATKINVEWSMRDSLDHQHMDFQRFYQPTVEFSRATRKMRISCCGRSSLHRPSRHQISKLKMPTPNIHKTLTKIFIFLATAGTSSVENVKRQKIGF